MSGSEITQLSVIIVTYNSSQVIADCLRSIRAAVPVEVIVIDNASHDDSIEVVAATRPDARIIRNSDNVGFALAVNRAAAAANGSCILLLNPDAQLAPDTIDTALAAFAADPQVAVVGPLIAEGHGTFRTIPAGFTPTIWRMFTHLSGLSGLGSAHGPFRGHYLLHSQIVDDSHVEVDWVTGGCMFVRATAWARSGGLPTRWFMYAEDVAFCLSVQGAGGSIVLTPASVATHVGGGSSGGTDHAIQTLWVRHLADLYEQMLAPSAAHAWLWRVVVRTGYTARAFVHRIAALGRHREVHLSEAARFAAYARAVDARGPQLSAGTDGDAFAAGQLVDGGASQQRPGAPA